MMREPRRDGILDFTNLKDHYKEGGFDFFGVESGTRTAKQLEVTERLMSS